MAVIGGNWPDIPTDFPESERLFGNFPQNITGLTDDNACALHAILEMLNVVHHRLGEIEKEIALKNKLDELISNKTGNK